MQKFYTGNAIYQLLDSTKNYKYTAENLWILVYGNRDCEPKVILLLSGYENSIYESKSLKQEESEIMIYAEQISKRSGVPMLYVRFNKDLPKINEVQIMVNGRFKKISLDEYTEILTGFGILKNNIGCKKPINSKASNVYHLWQINCGLDITTSDIDLIKIDDNLDITDVYELKRSTIKMDEWEPFSNDYNNFILLSKLLSKCNINFYIMFNEYRKTPFYDDISMFKFYKVNYNKQLILENLGKKSLLDFFLEK